MRMQDTAANCGPASLSNALQALGVSRTQAECETLCKTSGTEGTTSRGLQAGIKAVGRKSDIINERRADVALTFLRADLHAGRAAVLAVDKDEHWVAAVGLCGERFLIADPADNELVLSLSGDQLKSRWASPVRYYGVVIL